MVVAMKIIKLTQSKSARVSDQRYDEISQYKWYALNCRGWWYAARMQHVSKGKRIQVFMHQQILGCKFVDHRDGDGLNNEDWNLRAATGFQNQWNRGKNANNTSGFKNVEYNPKVDRWYGRFSYKNRRFRTGGYETAEEAHKSVVAAQDKHHKEFAHS